MYRLGVKNCFGSSPICSEGKKTLSFYIILNFSNHVTPLNTFSNLRFA